MRSRFEEAAARGDDALVLGHRLGEWCGHAPTIELDLGLANLALDLIGQAEYFLACAAELDGGGRDADALAFRRDVYGFRNCLLVEQPNGDFGRTVVRQFLFSTWQNLLFERLADLPASPLAAIAAKSVKEVSYHVRFSGDWMVRLGDGTAESRRRTEAGLDWCWRFVDELFEPGNPDLIASGFAVDPRDLRADWDAAVDAMLSQAGMERPKVGRGVSGGRCGRHGEHLGHLLSQMQFLQRAYPDAKW